MVFVQTSICCIKKYSLHRKKVYTCGKAKYSKSRGARGKVGGAPHPPLSWFEFQNDSWPSLDQLNGGFGAPPTFHVALLSFEYSARQKCILSFGGDCIYWWVVERGYVKFQCKIKCIEWLHRGWKNVLKFLLTLIHRYKKTYKVTPKNKAVQLSFGSVKLLGNEKKNCQHIKLHHCSYTYKPIKLATYSLSF